MAPRSKSPSSEAPAAPRASIAKRSTSRRAPLPASIASELAAAAAVQAPILEGATRPKPVPRDTRSTERSGEAEARNRRAARAAKKLEIGSVTGVRGGALGPLASFLIGSR